MLMLLEDVVVIVKAEAPQGGRAHTLYRVVGAV